MKDWRNPDREAEDRRFQRGVRIEALSIGLLLAVMGMAMLAAFLQS